MWSVLAFQTIYTHYRITHLSRGIGGSQQMSIAASFGLPEPREPFITRPAPPPPRRQTTLDMTLGVLVLFDVVDIDM